MKNPADKTNLKYLPGVCRLIRENAHNQIMTATKLEIAQYSSAPPASDDDLPHPSPHFLPCS